MNIKDVEVITDKAEMTKGSASNAFSYLTKCLPMWSPTRFKPISVNHTRNCTEYACFSIGRKKMLMYILNIIVIAEYPPIIIPACITVSDHLNRNRHKASIGIDNTRTIYAIIALPLVLNTIFIFFICCILLLIKIIIKMIPTKIE